jgi:predicted RNA-binding protein with PUA-like domain
MVVVIGRAQRYEARVATRYWLVKSEPEVFSFGDLKKAPKKTTSWEGVRNYQARNLLRDELKVGDGVLFYHSSTDPQNIAGTATVAREGYPDPTQFDPKSDYYDADSKKEDPRWFMVDIRFDKEFKKPLTRDELKAMKGLEQMVLLKKGSRLSVQPVSPKEWELILARGL